MSNESKTSETVSVVAQTPVKFTFAQIREEARAIAKPNDPHLDQTLQNEERTRALGSLLVELCDRITEMHTATAAGIRRLTGQATALETRAEETLGEIAAIAQMIEPAGGGVPTAPSAVGAVPSEAPPLSVEAQAAAELAAIPIAMRPATVAKPTPIAPNGGPPTDKRRPSVRHVPAGAPTPTASSPASAPTATAPPPAGDAAAIAASLNKSDGVPTASILRVQKS